MAHQQVIIDSLSCPITGEIMTDPVQGNDGHTYERSAIMQALLRKSESPMTRQLMTVTDLRVNANIRYLIDKYNDGTLTGSMDVSNSVSASISVNSEHPNIKSAVVTNGANTMFSFDIDASVEVEKPLIGTDLVICIDHSGSMGQPVEAKDETGNALENGFTQQDMVNHAAKTVAKSMSPVDRLCIITFDNVIEIILPLMLMTELNSVRAIGEIENVYPRNSTDIWHAIEEGIDVLHTRDDKTRNAAIILLTDGIPNISPSRGEVRALKDKRKKIGFNCPVYTVGFGYNLEKDLLYNLAKIGDGITGHIPDAGMIATVFSNFLGNILCTVAYNMQLTIDFTDGIDVPKIHGNFEYELSMNRAIIKMGTIQLGQTRNIIISGRTSCNYTYSYTIGNNEYSFTQEVGSMSISQNSKSIIPQLARFHVVEQLAEIIKSKNINVTTITKFQQLVSYFTDKDMSHPLMGGLYDTLTDQVRLAISEDPLHTTNYQHRTVPYFVKWGRWYLDQLRRALNQEMKPNFKDNACCFGGSLFNKIVDYASDQFDNLPPPKPSNQEQINQYRSAGTPMPAAQMASYNSQATPCFTGDSSIMLWSGKEKYVKNLVCGDIVKTFDYKKNVFTKAKVVCVLKTVITTGITDLVTFDSGLKITPWHPVFTGGKWQFPIALGKVKEEMCGAVYSILLDDIHTIIINGVCCIGLGHSYSDGILKHEYFGTNAVVQDLKRLDGWKEGLVIIDKSYIVRDDNSGNIIGIYIPFLPKQYSPEYYLPVLSHVELKFGDLSQEWTRKTVRLNV